MSSQSAANAQLSASFRLSTGKPQRETKPFSIRLSAEERSFLSQMAGNRPLGAYCREVLLGQRAKKRIELRQPNLDNQQYASLLAALGESRLSSNLNQLAKHANMGTLDVSQDIEGQLEEAYRAVLAMRDALITALEIKLR